MEDIIRRAALENARKFKGKANPKALIGVVMRECPSAKQDMSAATKLINAIVAEVNALSLEEQEKALLAIDPAFQEKLRAQKSERKESRGQLPELEGAVQGQVITRMPPEPSKYNHLGHALNFLINYLYAQKYDGKCILRFDDTNPEKETQEFVEAMEQDVLEYLNITPSETVFASDHLPKYIAACSDLIKRDLAYTCTCPAATMSENRRAEKECACRAQTKDTTMQHWEQMQSGEQDEGSMTLRLKIDMQHKNAVMRDPVIMRIIHTPHYRQKDAYKVWPMYDFESALEDAWSGVTHTLRSNEFESRIELHRHIQTLFELPTNYVKQYGRFNIVGATTQGREIRELIEQKKVIGWDDPRLVTLRALKRRGIVREAFYELAKSAGMSKTQTNIDFSVLAAINRKILDEQANRYFFIEEPVKISVQNWPADLTEIELKLHPHKNRGGRPLKLDGEFYIAKKDHDAIITGQKNTFRLIDTANITYDAANKTFTFLSTAVEDFKKTPSESRFGLIHFLPANEKNITATMFTPEAKTITGLCEHNVAQLRAGAVIQFERYCFARLDAIKAGTYNFWFTHE